MIDTEKTVTAALSGVRDDLRREALRALLVRPTRRDLEFVYSEPTEVRECWIVAAAPGNEIVFCPDGFSGDGKYQWGVIVRGSDSMERDDCWFVSLDEAFMGSGLWKGKIPAGFQVS